MSGLNSLPVTDARFPIASPRSPPSSGLRSSPGRCAIGGRTMSQVTVPYCCRTRVSRRGSRGRPEVSPGSSLRRWHHWAHRLSGERVVDLVVDAGVWVEAVLVSHSLVCGLTSPTRHCCYRGIEVGRAAKAPSGRRGGRVFSITLRDRRTGRFPRPCRRTTLSRSGSRRRPQDAGQRCRPPPGTCSRSARNNWIPAAARRSRPRRSSPARSRRHFRRRAGCW